MVMMLRNPFVVFGWWFHSEICCERKTKKKTRPGRTLKFTFIKLFQVFLFFLYIIQQNTYLKCPLYTIVAYIIYLSLLSYNKTTNQIPVQNYKTIHQNIHCFFIRRVSLSPRQTTQLLSQQVYLLLTLLIILSHLLD